MPAPLLRPMTLEDVDAVLAVQQPGSVLGLAEVFSQDTHPFPVQEVAGRWRDEVADPVIDCFVIQAGDDHRGEADVAVAGFAAVRGEELLHFGVAVEHWGTDLAGRAHDELLALMRAAGVEVAWLRVFTGNGRGRRFYAKHGWRETGERSRSTFEPRPELVRCERRL